MHSFAPSAARRKEAGRERTAADWTGFFVCLFVASSLPVPRHRSLSSPGRDVPTHGIFSLLCFPFQYVRREIRQLTDKDRVAFFDAMEKLYRLPTHEGAKLYGDAYKVCTVRAAGTTLTFESKQF